MEGREVRARIDCLRHEEIAVSIPRKSEIDRSSGHGPCRRGLMSQRDRELTPVFIHLNDSMLLNRQRAVHQKAEGNAMHLQRLKRTSDLLGIINAMLLR